MTMELEVDYMIFNLKGRVNKVFLVVGETASWPNDTAPETGAKWKFAILFVFKNVRILATGNITNSVSVVFQTFAALEEEKIFCSHKS